MNQNHNKEKRRRASPPPTTKLFRPSSAPAAYEEAAIHTRAADEEADAFARAADLKVRARARVLEEEVFPALLSRPPQSIETPPPAPEPPVGKLTTPAGAGGEFVPAHAPAAIVTRNSRRRACRRACRRNRGRDCRLPRRRRG